MAFRLATVVGELDIDAMLSTITPQEFSEWIAYDAIEPIGLIRQNKILALIASALVSFKDHASNPDDFYPHTTTDPSVEPSGTGTDWLSPAAMKARLATAVAMARGQHGTR